MYENTLSVANTRFVVNLDHSNGAAVVTGDTYNQFINCDALPTDHCINISLSESTEHIKTGTPLFHTDGGWSLSDVAGKYLISSHRGSIEDGRGWNALCDKDFSNIEITLPPGHIEKTMQSLPGIPALRYPLDQILLFHSLIKRGGLLIHSAGVTVTGCGILLSGPSGAGKSTISAMLQGCDDVQIINDDRMVVQHSKAQGWMMHGTPWPGDLQIAENISMPLAALCFLKHGDSLELAPLDRMQALQRLFPVTSVPWYIEDMMTQATRLAEKLITDIPTYELGFRPGDPVKNILANIPHAN